MDLDKLKIDRAPQKPRRRRGGIAGLAWSSVAALILVPALLWLFRDPLQRQVDKLTLQEVEVTTATRTSALSAGAISGTAANGYVVAAKRAALSADTPGRVVEMNVVEGSSVKAGDVVARLYSEEYEAALAGAVAEEVAARAGVERAKADVATARKTIESRKADREAAEARVRSVIADAALAQKELSRQTQLVERGVSSDSLLDTARTNADRTAALAEAERAAFKAAGAAIVEAEARITQALAAVAESEARIAVAEANADRARATLEKTYVRAPFDGIVVLKDAEVGEVVSPNSQGGSSRGSVATLVDLASLEVQIDLPETLLPKVQLDTPARIFLDAFPREAYEGRVLRIWPTANRQKATIEIRVGFDAPDERLRPDLGARVVFAEEGFEAANESAPEPDQVQVPASAVVRIDGEDGVFLLERDTVRWQVVTTGEGRAGRAVITSGLEGGERVLSSPPADLEDGERVRVAN